METFEGIKISKEELEYIKTSAKRVGCLYMKDAQFLDNLTVDKDSTDKWNLRISRVSAKDLPNHDNKYYTDGNNNGKTLLIHRLEVQ